MLQFIHFAHRTGEKVNAGA